MWQIPEENECIRARDLLTSMICCGMNCVWTTNRILPNRLFISTRSSNLNVQRGAGERWSLRRCDVAGRPCARRRLWSRRTFSRVSARLRGWRRRHSAPTPRRVARPGFTRARPLSCAACRCLLTAFGGGTGPDPAVCGGREHGPA